MWGKWKWQNKKTRKKNTFCTIHSSVITNELFLFVDPYMFSNEHNKKQTATFMKSKICI